MVGNNILALCICSNDGGNDGFVKTVIYLNDNTYIWYGMSQAASALGVRGPRQSVGVQVEGGAYCVMLPYSVCAPCSAKQIFTTTQDNQSQVGFVSHLRLHLTRTAP